MTDDNNNQLESMRKAILDALGDIGEEVEAATRPTLPLVGSLNVEIDKEEEKSCE